MDYLDGQYQQEETKNVPRINTRIPTGPIIDTTQTQENVSAPIRTEDDPLILTKKAALEFLMLHAESVLTERDQMESSLDTNVTTDPQSESFWGSNLKKNLQAYQKLQGKLYINQIDTNQHTLIHYFFNHYKSVIFAYGTDEKWISSGCERFLRYLCRFVKEGANFDFPDRQDISPRDIARENGIEKILDFVLKQVSRNPDLSLSMSMTT